MSKLINGVEFDDEDEVCEATFVGLSNNKGEDEDDE